MSTLPNPALSLRDKLRSITRAGHRVISGATASAPLEDLSRGSNLDSNPENLVDRSILITTRDQLAAGLAIVALDGLARRMIICTPEIGPELFPALVQKGEVDTIVSDYSLPEQECFERLPKIRCRSGFAPGQELPPAHRTTEWVLLSSGTTSTPKMIAHTLASLTPPVRVGKHAGGHTTDRLGAVASAPEIVWGTFYDIRRYGGLQIFLRAVMGTGSLVLSEAAETPGAHLTRLAAHGVTHLSGTPSHWRRALMSPEARRIAPDYIRLSGEIADQPILSALHSFYPQARIGHAFASTEAGVAFEVNDGLAGFPAALLGCENGVEMRVVDDSLQIRSKRTAARYLGGESGALADEEGFVDTGDMVELRDGRFYFLGRRNGVINVGGLKVYPEEVEAVINRHPAVRMSVVRSRKNPFTGALVSADVMLKELLPPEAENSVIKREILEICRANLAPHKIPATVRYVPSLEVAAAGKLVRHHA